MKLYVSCALILVFALCGLSAQPTKSEVDAINCTPTDGWSVIFTLHNQSNGASTATYSKRVGTRWESSTPSDADAAAFFKKFGQELGEKNWHCGIDDVSNFFFLRYICGHWVQLEQYF